MLIRRVLRRTCRINEEVEVEERPGDGMLELCVKVMSDDSVDGTDTFT
jgi:hypothetical protein